ncbi:MAG: Holliday junction resolvase RuvX [Candidatus Aureabacteria bacterium]|nr:Holliday junction resolvase RuvX [Candidatus Auribacterota bacterium]
MRLLGLDVGTVRIGMAISDPSGITAQGAGFIERKSAEGTIALLREIIVRHTIASIVMGLPRNMDGSEGESARAARAFSLSIERALGIPVVMWDERLTTAEADRLMKGAGLSRKKRAGRVDQMAAQLILQSYLDCHR